MYVCVLLCSWIIVCPKGLYVNRWSAGGFWEVDGTFKRAAGPQKHSTDLRALVYSSFLLLCGHKDQVCSAMSIPHDVLPTVGLKEWGCWQGLELLKASPKKTWCLAVVLG